MPFYRHTVLQVYRYTGMTVYRRVMERFLRSAQPRRAKYSEPQGMALTSNVNPKKGKDHDRKRHGACHALEAEACP